MMRRLSTLNFRLLVQSLLPLHYECSDPGVHVKPFLSAFVLLGLTVCVARGQGNYEIQVYGADTVLRGNTMFELHSNFTADGQRRVINRIPPTYRAEHETIEITQGVTKWSEV